MSSRSSSAWLWPIRSAGSSPESRGWAVPEVPADGLAGWRQRYDRLPEEEDEAALQA